MVVLDTDHASELGFHSSAGVRLLHRLSASGEDAAVTAITVEEQMRGWLSEISRRADPAEQIGAYDRLVRQVELFASWMILPWDSDAVEWFRILRNQRIRVGTQDLKIASIVLAHDATLLTKHPRLRPSARSEDRKLAGLMFAGDVQSTKLQTTVKNGALAFCPPYSGECATNRVVL